MKRRWLRLASLALIVSVLGACGSVPRWQAPSGTGGYDGATGNVPTYR